MTERNVNRNYKDTVFRMLFEDKENLLSLYNAVNGTHYTDTENLEITTLQDAVYMNYKNDVSFVFDFFLNLYEHQSTFNRNMPLRDLIYVTKVIQGIIRDEDLYSSGQIRIPTPRFVVFYNGVEPQPPRQVLRLSDAYRKKLENVELELTVTVYNINYGNNQELMETCRTLKEYARYVDMVRKYAREKNLAEAVETAVDTCIREGILSDFLKKHRAEAIEMSIFEYDEEKHLKSEREIWKQAGIEEGKKLGLEEGIEKGIEKGIERGIVTGKAEEIVETGQEFGLSEPDILKRLQTRLAISAEQARAYLVEFGRDKKLS